MIEQEKSLFIIEDLSNDNGFLMLQVSNLWENCHFNRYMVKLLKVND